MSTDYHLFPNSPLWGKRADDPADEILLEGLHSRGSELVRALRIFAELIHGFRQLHFVGPCVTVFGSARTPETHPHYLSTRELGARLAQAKFTVMTGGGPGVMEAANRGAKDVGGKSLRLQYQTAQGTEAESVSR